VRQVVDLNTRGELLIDAVSVAGDVGNVVVQQVEPSAGVWLVEVYNRPGPPEPVEKWLTWPPPAMFTIHVCPEVPTSWPARSATEAQEVATL
jgi:hypothetical protein